MKSKVKVILYFILTLLSIPVAGLLSFALTQNDDAAGKGMSGGIFFLIIFFLASLLFGGNSMTIYIKNRKSLGKLFVVLASLSLTPCLLILLVTFGLIVLEVGYALLK